MELLKDLTNFLFCFTAFLQCFSPESLPCDMAVLCAQLGGGAVSRFGVQEHGEDTEPQEEISPQYD